MYGSVHCLYLFVRNRSHLMYILYYWTDVPQVTLIVDALETEGGKHLMEKAIYVMEGQTVTFICAVKARPKPYSFKWFHNVSWFQGT